MVSLIAEVPDPIYDGLQAFLEAHPEWDYERAVTAALSLFLLQNAGGNSGGDAVNHRRAARVYLNTLFGGNA